EPSTRMGNIAVDRATWARAVEYKRKWDKYETDGGEPPTRDIAMDTLRGVLAGEIRVQNHCYRADEMAIVLDMAKEFGYHVSAFHHAVEAYKIADLLKASGTCAAVWADWWGFKMEAYDAISENLALLHNAGACAMIHSDDANGIQRLNQEVGKALAAGRRAGIQISDATAWTWLTINPARALGIDDKTGSLKPGKMADLVLWNGNPFSVYSRPEKVWIDGALLYDANDPTRRPVSDFELGQPGAGDVK
ncbi:MAG TPA: amidohydrolase family protein, partial [Sphingomonas sp.]|nr:amidohydrolase family protein [Sphingomonas sp.]